MKSLQKSLQFFGLKNSTRSKTFLKSCHNSHFKQNNCPLLNPGTCSYIIFISKDFYTENIEFYFLFLNENFGKKNTNVYVVTCAPNIVFKDFLP